MQDDEFNPNYSQGQNNSNGQNRQTSQTRSQNPSQDLSHNHNDSGNQSSSRDGNKNFGRSYRNDDYNNKAGRQSERDQYGSNPNPQQEGQAQYQPHQPDQKWNQPARQSGFGQSNQRDQSYGQQYGRSYTRGADQGSYGQEAPNNSRYQNGSMNGYSNSNEFDNRNDFGGNESQHSIYGSAGFGSLGNNSNSLSRNSSSESSSGHQTPRSLSMHPNPQGRAVESHYGKGPKSYKRSDDRIKEEISEIYTRHHEIDASDIEIEVKDGEVTLSGFVPERRMKYIAEDLADQSMGVRDVINGIRVKKEERSMTDSVSNEEDRFGTKAGGKKGGPGSVNNPNH